MGGEVEEIISTMQFRSATRKVFPESGCFLNQSLLNSSHFLHFCCFRSREILLLAT